MARYSKTAQKSVEREMRAMKQGTLKSGKSGKKVTSRKQAIAIGLSEARKKGAKVPVASSQSKSSTRSHAHGMSGKRKSSRGSNKKQ